uniref:RanBD1 domain-containing protein n=1 Tax=Leptocylindrus danicus TaxID=163516 RepID=A0A7S2KZ98_9STRA|mmetsp:Transcript_2924/g.4195  ORF Transcript_2924/g.4195 Transcript_2924/m.4195 type:complete len:359 (+) Transcript_2924:32-1108(+)
MGKRGNENAQARKEDYEAENDNEQEESSSASGGMFRRASAEQLKNRRIAKVKGGKWAQPKKTRNNMSTSSTPQNGGSKAPSNPFAGFQGLAPSAMSASTPKISFQSAPLQSAAVTSNTSSSSTKTTKDHKFFTYFEAMAKHRAKESWSAGIKDAIREEISAMKQFALVSSNVAAATVPSAEPSFSFGAKTNNSQTSAAATTKPFTGFSFGGAKATPMPVTTSAAGATTTADGDENGFPKEEREAVAKEENKDENVLYEVRAKLYKFSDGGLKASDAGPVQLLQRKDDPSKKRLVMRNDVGKVRLNEAIGKGMTLKKREIVKGRSTGSVMFQSAGGTFELKTKVENLDALYSAINNAVN